MSEKYLQSDNRVLLEGLGTELCWGWSPAIDFSDYIPPPDDNEDSQSQQQQQQQGKSSSSASAAQVVDEGDDDDDDFAACMAELGLDPKKARSGAEEGEESGESSSAGQRPYRVLLCGAADIRHVFYTMARLKTKEAEKAAAASAEGSHRKPQNKKRKQPAQQESRVEELDDDEEQEQEQAPPPLAATPSSGRPVHFYFYEPNLRVHCRHLVLLQLVCDTRMTFAELEDRVAMFLEVYANTMLREITATQLKSQAASALRAWGFEEGPLAKLIDTSEMKSKEKDFVEDQVRHWTKDSSSCDIDEQWDKRVRNQMAERYDNKVNVIDWEFNFQLKDYSTQLKFPEYREWRITGMGYDYARVNPRKGFQYDYTAINRSLVHFNRQGLGAFLGDVKNGPFWGFGGNTENNHLSKPGFQGEIKCTNGIIAMHNVRAWWYELMTGKPWPWTDHQFAWDDPKYYNYLPPGTPPDVEFAVQLPLVKFFFVGLDYERFSLRQRSELSSASGGGGGFDAAFVGANCTHVLHPANKEDVLFNLMKDTGLVFVESLKFIVDAQDEAKQSFTVKILDIASQNGWELDAKRTGHHHRFQVPPRDEDSVKNDLHKKAQERARMPHHLILQKKKEVRGKKK